METLATVGYGEMYPATTYGHIVSAAGIMSGMAFTAITTGLIFVRFSRPRSNVLYADQVVITPYNGLPTLMVRIGNGRMSPLTNLHHVRFGMKYADAVTVDPNGRTMADLTRISLLEPDGTEMAGEIPELRAVQ